MPILIVSSARAAPAASANAAPAKAPVARKKSRLLRDMANLVECALSSRAATAWPLGAKGCVATSVPRLFRRDLSLSAESMSRGAEEIIRLPRPGALGALRLGSTITDAGLRFDDPRRGRVALDLGAQL